MPSPVALYLEYVRLVLRVLKPLRRTWVLSHTLYLMFQALELLPKHGRSDKVAALLQKAVLAVPEGMPMVKTVVLARALWYTPVVASRKVTAERRKLVDNTLGLAHQIGLSHETELVNEVSAMLDAAAAAASSPHRDRTA